MSQEHIKPPPPFYALLNEFSIVVPFNLTFNLWFVHSVLAHVCTCTCMYIVFTHFNEMLEKLEKVQSSFEEVRMYIYMYINVNIYT